MKGKIYIVLVVVRFICSMHWGILFSKKNFLIHKENFQYV